MIFGWSAWTWESFNARLQGLVLSREVADTAAVSFRKSRRLKEGFIREEG